MLFCGAELSADWWNIPSYNGPASPPALQQTAACIWGREAGRNRNNNSLLKTYRRADGLTVGCSHVPQFFCPGCPYADPKLQLLCGFIGCFTHVPSGCRKHDSQLIGSAPHTSLPPSLTLWAACLAAELRFYYDCDVVFTALPATARSLDMQAVLVEYIHTNQKWQIVMYCHPNMDLDMQ